MGRGRLELSSERYVDSQHTEAARTIARSTAAAEAATPTTAQLFCAARRMTAVIYTEGVSNGVDEHLG
jgi:hypothetical protein